MRKEQIQNGIAVLRLQNETREEHALLVVEREKVRLLELRLVERDSVVCVTIHFALSYPPAPEAHLFFLIALHLLVLELCVGWGSSEECSERRADTKCHQGPSASKVDS